MKILHTSDWHLGKTLEGYSRMEEQQKFIEELIEISENKKIDMIIISGDIYDTGNPPAIAERLFYNSAKILSQHGKRPILVIAGNHDNPERLTAASSLAYEHGIIILGTPKSIAQSGEYENYKILSSGEGYIEIEINNEKAIIITIPYPSEKRINELINNEIEQEEKVQKTYSQKIGEIFDKLSKNYRDDTINIATGHFFMLGSESSDSERPIQLGGGLAVEPAILPNKAQYIALGHLHRPQKVGRTNIKAYYSGSPIQYSKSEINYAKCVYIVDIEANLEAKIEKVMLRNYKPIEIWTCNSVEEALKKCEDNKDRQIWVYIDIHTDRTILTSEIKAMRILKKDIVEIHTILKEVDYEENDEIIEEKSIHDLFKDFYTKENNISPSKEITDLFINIVLDKEDEYET